MILLPKCEKNGALKTVIMGKWCNLGNLGQGVNKRGREGERKGGREVMGGGREGMGEGERRNGRR